MVCHGSKGVQQLLSCMNSGTACRSKERIIPLYVALVRPHLDAASSCGPQHKKDMDILEGAQWRATKVVGLEHLSHK